MNNLWSLSRKPPLTAVLCGTLCWLLLFGPFLFVSQAAGFAETGALGVALEVWAFAALCLPGAIAGYITRARPVWVGVGIGLAAGVLGFALSTLQFGFDLAFTVVRNFGIGGDLLFLGAAVASSAAAHSLRNRRDHAH